MHQGVMAPLGWVDHGRSSDHGGPRLEPCLGHHLVIKIYSGPRGGKKGTGGARFLQIFGGVDLRKTIQTQIANCGQPIHGVSGKKGKRRENFTSYSPQRTVRFSIWKTFKNSSWKPKLKHNRKNFLVKQVENPITPSARNVFIHTTENRFTG